MAIIGRSPAVRKVVWLYCLSGREGGEQLLVAGYTSVDKNLVLLSPSPPVRRSRFASLGEPEDCKLIEVDLSDGQERKNRQKNGAKFYKLVWINV